MKSRIEFGRGRTSRLAAIFVVLLAVLLLPPYGANAAGRLGDFLGGMKAADIDPAADSFGEGEGNPPAAKLLNGG